MSPARGCVSQQIKRHSDGSARSCAIEISLVVVFFVLFLFFPHQRLYGADESCKKSADTHPKKGASLT